ncbi:histidine kinase [Synergistales bacterium]|nr:histidine kinase [Synergistales bacterium]
MLEDLSQHILDIAENSSGAGASSVIIEISEDVRANVLSMTVEDNGCGMSPEFLAKVTDPFTTTRTTRRVGMGLPFLKQSSEMCGGEFSISSEPGKGTRTRATFAYDNIDRPPLGDIPATVMTIFMGHTEIDWTYKHVYNGREFSVTTLELVEALEDRELLSTIDVGLWIRDMVSEGLAELLV